MKTKPKVADNAAVTVDDEAARLSRVAAFYRTSATSARATQDVGRAASELAISRCLSEFVEQKNSSCVSSENNLEMLWGWIPYKFK